MIKDIKDLAERLVASLRELSVSQASLWQQVPYLALQADGRTGYSDQYSRAYRQGYWAIEPSLMDYGSYMIYVDLETGEFVDGYIPTNSANAKNILMLANYPEQLDVYRIIRYLKKECKKPTQKNYDKKEQKTWRESLRKKFSLKPHKYSRKVSPGEIAKQNIIASLVE